MAIEILKFSPINKGACVGYLDIFVPKMGLEIFGCSIWTKEGSRWINMPQREYTSPEGEKKYLSIVRFKEKAHMDEFGRAVLSAFDEWQKANTPKVMQAPPQRMFEQPVVGDKLPW